MARSITVRGVTYDSHSAAARALGVTPSVVTQAAIRGNVDRIGLRGKNPPRGMTVLVRYRNGRERQVYYTHADLVAQFGDDDVALLRAGHDIQHELSGRRVSPKDSKSLGGSLE